MAASGAAGPGWLRRRLTAILLAVSLLVNVCFIAGAVWIHLHPPVGIPPFDQRYPRMAARLDLDASQRVEFNKYVTAMRVRNEKIRQQVEPLLTGGWAELAKP